jgi:hypothetical protein
VSFTVEVEGEVVATSTAEPGTISLLASGLGMLFFVVRRRRRTTKKLERVPWARTAGYIAFWLRCPGSL